MSFKDDVLQALGIQLNPDITAFQTAYNINNNEITAPTANNGKVNKNSLSNYINKLVNKGIENTINNINDQAQKKQKYREMERDLKTFTLDDIIKLSQGVEISKEMLNQNVNKSLDRAGSYDPNIDKNFKRLGNNKNIFYRFININSNDLKKGDFVFKINNVDEQDSGKLADRFGTVLEDAIAKRFGGELNTGGSDSVKDLTVSGINISVKCLKDGNISPSKLSEPNVLSKNKSNTIVLIYKKETEYKGGTLTIKCLINKIFKIKNNTVYKCNFDRNNDDAMESIVQHAKRGREIKSAGSVARKFIKKSWGKVQEEAEKRIDKLEDSLRNRLKKYLQRFIVYREVISSDPKTISQDNLKRIITKAVDETSQDGATHDSDIKNLTDIINAAVKSVFSIKNNSQNNNQQSNSQSNNQQSNPQNSKSVFTYFKY